MIVARTLESSGETSRSRSSLVFDGTIWSSGTSSPVLDSWSETRPQVGQLKQLFNADSTVSQSLDHR